MGSRSVEPLALHLPSAEGDRGHISERLAAVTPALAAARDELVAAWRPMDAQGPMAAHWLLEDYRGAGGKRVRQSRLGQILARARLLADQVDRVVVVAGRDVCLAAKAVLASCAHPYHNELTRAQRGGYPRVDFEAGSVDNDALAGLLDVLAPPRPSADLDSRWALVSVEDGTLETAATTRVLAQALEAGLSGQSDRLGQLLVTLPGPGQPEMNEPFTSGVLLAAALAGLDVVGLLSGAEAVIERFVHDRPHDCPVLQFAGLCHLAGRPTDACGMAVWSRALEPAGRWYGRLRRRAWAGRAVGSQENASPPANGLHRNRPPEKIGTSRLVVSVVAERLRRDRLTIHEPVGNGEPAALAGTQLAEIVQATRASSIAAQQAAGQLAVELRLPRIDERSVGQLMQFLLLATAVEVRLAMTQHPKPIHV